MSSNLLHLHTFGAKAAHFRDALWRVFGTPFSVLEFPSLICNVLPRLSSDRLLGGAATYAKCLGNLIKRGLGFGELSAHLGHSLRREDAGVMVVAALSPGKDKFRMRLPFGLPPFLHHVLGIVFARSSKQVRRIAAWRRIAFVADALNTLKASVMVKVRKAVGGDRFPVKAGDAIPPLAPSHHPNPARTKLRSVFWNRSIPVHLGPEFTLTHLGSSHKQRATHQPQREVRTNERHWSQWVESLRSFVCSATSMPRTVFAAFSPMSTFGLVVQGGPALCSPGHPPF